LTNGEKAQISGGCTFGGGDNDWTITGGCGAGIFDNIRFDPLITQINLQGGVLSITDNGTWIDGQNGVPRIDASGLPSVIFFITASHVTISNLSLINGNPVVRGDIWIGRDLVDTRIAYN
jgi:hypothetical protein